MCYKALEVVLCVLEVLEGVRCMLLAVCRSVGLRPWRVCSVRWRC
jgi:hypothetical protein